MAWITLTTDSAAIVVLIIAAAIFVAADYAIGKVRKYPNKVSPLLDVWDLVYSIMPIIIATIAVLIAYRSTGGFK